MVTYLAMQQAAPGLQQEAPGLQHSLFCLAQVAFFALLFPANTTVPATNIIATIPIITFFILSFFEIN
jgi:hypothetical protein